MACFETKTTCVLGNEMEPYQVSQLTQQAVQTASQPAYLCPQVTFQLQSKEEQKLS